MSDGRTVGRVAYANAALSEITEDNLRTIREYTAAAVPEMMYLAVRPYLGEEAARRELTIPPPTAND